MPRRLLLLFALGVVAGTFGCGRTLPGGAPGGRDNTCRDHGDCVAGERCDAGRCVLGALCTNGSECPAETTCGPAAGGVSRCVPAVGSCEAGGCPDGYRCAGAPQACIPHQPACVADVDCGAGRRCREGACELIDAGCRADDDCASPERPRCERASNTCVACLDDADCAEGEECDDGRCVKPPPPPCTADGDCPAGQGCRDGACVPVGPPLCGNVTCGDGEKCVDGACRRSCDSDGQCGGRGFICRDGNVCGPGCRVDAHCPQGSRCVNLTCTGGCAGENGCVGDANEPFCHPQRDACVQCLQDSHCGAGQVCDANRSACRTGCRPGDARTCPPGSLCHPQRLECVQCIDDRQCDGGGRCDRDFGVCVECLVDGDCPGGRCQPERRECFECLTDADCDGRTCVDGACAGDGGLGLCEECESDDDCGGPRDLCVRLSFGGEVLERACGIDCAEAPCPSGLRCIDVGDRGRQCFPSNGEDVSSCAGYRDTVEGVECQTNGDCGIEDVRDASCRNYSVDDPQKRCTLTCEGDADCPEGFRCADIDGPLPLPPRCVPR